MTSSRRKSVLKVALLASSATLALAPAVLAQDAVGAGGPTNRSGTSVTEVIVTAQKQNQRLQDVPVVVTVLNQQKLQDAQVKSVQDLTVLTPGLNVTTNGDESTTIARIRGVGNVADNPGLEDAVGLYIDGVYRPRNGVSFNDLGELSDMEILKGPQGTLFGKNTIAGVIQVTTQRPTFNFARPGGRYGAELRRLRRLAVGQRPPGGRQARGPPLRRRSRARRLRSRRAGVEHATFRRRTTNTSIPFAVSCCSRPSTTSTSTSSATTASVTITAASLSTIRTACRRR